MPFVVARVYTNAAGYPEFAFSHNPFVHSTEHHAENEARKLSKRFEAEFAVFPRVLTVECETTIKTAGILHSDDIADALVALLVDSNGTAADIRKRVDAALTQLLNQP